MEQKEYKKLLIISLKTRGYKWDTVMSGGKKEIPLEEAPVRQLIAIRDGLDEKNRKKLLDKVAETLRDRSKERVLSIMVYFNTFFIRDNISNIL